MTKTISKQLRFPTISGMSVRAAFDGGAMSSDFGATLSGSGLTHFRGQVSHSNIRSVFFFFLMPEKRLHGPAHGHVVNAEEGSDLFHGISPVTLNGVT